MFYLWLHASRNFILNFIKIDQEMAELYDISKICKPIFGHEPQITQFEPIIWQTIDIFENTPKKTLADFLVCFWFSNGTKH